MILGAKLTQFTLYVKNSPQSTFMLSKGVEGRPALLMTSQNPDFGLDSVTSYKININKLTYFKVSLRKNLNTMNLL